MEHPIIDITPWLILITMTVSVRVSSMGQIDQLEKYSYLIEPWQKVLIHNYTKNAIWTYNEGNSLTSRDKISLDE